MFFSLLESLSFIFESILDYLLFLAGSIDTVKKFLNKYKEECIFELFKTATISTEISAS